MSTRLRGRTTKALGAKQLFGGAETRAQFLHGREESWLICECSGLKVKLVRKNSAVVNFENVQRAIQATSMVVNQMCL